MYITTTGLWQETRGFYDSHSVESDNETDNSSAHRLSIKAQSRPALASV